MQTWIRKWKNILLLEGRHISWTPKLNSVTLQQFTWGIEILDDLIEEVKLNPELHSLHKSKSLVKYEKMNPQQKQGLGVIPFIPRR